MSKTTLKNTLIAGASALALIAGPGLIEKATGIHFDSGVAQAQQGQGHQGGGGGGQGGQGGGGKGGSGSGSGGSSTDSGQHGPSADSDAKGPKYQGGTSQTGSHGGKPVWAQEGIPEVELGRLSVARSPDKVIDKALAEAVANFDPALSATLYSMTAEQFAAYLQANYATVTRIDSPLENLGLYKDILADGQTQLAGVTPASSLDLAAIFLGSASDKTIPVTTDTVVAVTTIMQLPALTDAQVASLAAKAEAVRLAILAGHGE